MTEYMGRVQNVKLDRDGEEVVDRDVICHLCGNNGAVILDVTEGQPDYCVPCPGCFIGKIREDADFGPDTPFWILRRRERLTFEKGKSARSRPCSSCRTLFERGDGSGCFENGPPDAQCKLRSANTYRAMPMPQSVFSIIGVD